MCFHGGGEHLGLPQTSSCPPTTEWVSFPQGKQVARGAMPRVTSGACMGCSAAGIPEGECAGSSPSAWIQGLGVLLPGQLRP